MIPTLKLRPEYHPTTTPILMGFHARDENGKTVGVLTKEEVIQMYLLIKENNRRWT